MARNRHVYNEDTRRTERSLIKDMKSMSMLLGLIMAAAVAQSAVAEPWRDFRAGRFDVQAQRPRPGGERSQPERDFRRVERPPERGQRPDGRLTEEERRDLRRDIDRANREIYKGWRRQ